MRMEPTEAIDIFRGWASDFALVRYQGTFPNLAFSGWGRVVSAKIDELRIIADDRETELVLRLTPRVEFGYVDSRRVTGDEKKFKESVALFFGPIPNEGEPDMIVLAALENTS